MSRRIQGLVIHRPFGVGSVTAPPSKTLDTYSHMFPDDDDTPRDAIDAAFQDMDWTRDVEEHRGTLGSGR